MTKFIKCLIVSLVFGILFFLLSPGIILTLPPSSSVHSSVLKGVCSRGGVFFQMNGSNKSFSDAAGSMGDGNVSTKGLGGMCATNYAAVAVHSLLFALIVFLFCWLGCDWMKM